MALRALPLLEYLKMMPKDSTWAEPPLSAEDEKLVEAYVHAGRPLDDLPYTREFEALCRAIEVPVKRESMHAVFKRLLTLRKQGRLPRAYDFIGK